MNLNLKKNRFLVLLSDEVGGVREKEINAIGWRFNVFVVCTT